MTSNVETEVERRLSEAKAAEDRARVVRRAPSDELRWVQKNRDRIAAEALDLLRGDADDDVVERIDRVWSEAMQTLREKQRRQTEAARSAVADRVDVGQGSSLEVDTQPVRERRASRTGR